MENISLECDLTHYLNTDIVVHTAPPFSVDIYCGYIDYTPARINNGGSLRSGLTSQTGRDFRLSGAELNRIEPAAEIVGSGGAFYSSGRVEIQ